MKKMFNFLRGCYPDLLVQVGVFVFAIYKFQSCRLSFVGGCGHRDIHWGLVFAVMCITLGVNVLFYRFSKR